MSKYKFNKIKSQVGLVLYKNKPVVYGLVSSELIDSKASVFGTDLMEDSKDVRMVYISVDGKMLVMVNKDTVDKDLIKGGDYANIRYSDKIKETILTGKRDIHKAFDNTDYLANKDDLKDLLNDPKLVTIKEEVIEYDKELQKYLEK